MKPFSIYKSFPCLKPSPIRTLKLPMGKSMESNKISVLILSLLAVLVISVNGQISTPCTTSMITSFTPCINFVTGSTNNGSSPTSNCCNALKSLTGNSMDCACLLIGAGVPFQLPINRTLAISLPRACKMGGVPLQCEDSGSPLPAPGPVLFTPPVETPASSPRASKASTTSAPAPEPEKTTPPSPPEATKTTPGVRPVLTRPASGAAILKFSPYSALLILLLFMGFR